MDFSFFQVVMQLYLLHKGLFPKGTLNKKIKKIKRQKLVDCTIDVTDISFSE